MVACHSGNEEVLSLLDRNWENVEVQTSWQIEPCLIVPQKPEAASSSNVNVNGLQVPPLPMS